VVDLNKSSLVDQFPNTLLVGIAPGDVGFANTEHVKGSLVKLDEDSIVDLSETEQLKSFADLGVNLVYTPNSNDEGQFSFSWNIIVALVPGLASKSDFIALLGPVLLHVLLSPLENLHTLVPRKSLLLNCLFQL